jgi:hypothetical protein
MIYKARIVLDDCRHALDLMEHETRPESFRVLWVAGIALARAVGHVLQKVDADQEAALGRAVAVAYDSWKTDRSSNLIFWEFIELERNQILKQYDIGFFAGPVDVVVGREYHTLDDNLFCPITEGVFAGEDCRDVLREAIEWWERKLDSIESAAGGIAADEARR